TFFLHHHSQCTLLFVIFFIMLLPSPKSSLFPYTTLFRSLDKSLLKAAYGYAIDSNGDVGDIIISAPTQAKIFAKIKGKTAHAGVAPENGVSAITLAAKAISKMPLGRIDEETTANIGRFEGGQQTNIVCDYVEVLAEARSLVEEKMEKQVATMKEAFENTAKE